MSNESPLRIAMVTTFYPPFNYGGDGIYVQRLARALASRGHQVEVIHDTDVYRTMSGRCPDAPDRDGDIVVHRIGSRAPLLSSLAVQQAGRPVAHAGRIRKLLDQRFDVVHFHNISLIGGPGLWRYGTGVKLHTAHEHWMVCPTHILWRDNREVCPERRCLRCILTHRRPPQLWRLTDKVNREARHVDRFLMLSKAADDNHRNFGFKAPTTVVPSFLPKAESAGAAGPRTNHDRPYFLFVGRLEVIKGLQDVIPLFDADMPADLWIAGSGSLEPTLRKLARGRDNVRFLGHQPMETLRSLYRDAAAVVAPSRCYEVFPMVVLEAFREATPIVARALGPYPEIVAQTGAGTLFETPDDLRAALLRYATDPAAAADKGAQGRAAFDTLWSEDVVIEQYFDLIAATAAQKGMQDLATRAAAFGRNARAAVTA